MLSVLGRGESLNDGDCEEVFSLRRRLLGRAAYGVYCRSFKIMNVGSRQKKRRCKKPEEMQSNFEITFNIY